MSRGAHNFQARRRHQGHQGRGECWLDGEARRDRTTARSSVSLGRPDARLRRSQRMGRRAVKRKHPKYTHGYHRPARQAALLSSACRAASGCRCRDCPGRRNSWKRARAALKGRVGRLRDRRQPNRCRHRQRRARVLLSIERLQGWPRRELADKCAGRSWSASAKSTATSGSRCCTRRRCRRS